MTVSKAKNQSGVGRASFSPAEIAARNNLAVTTVYNALKSGKLKAANLGEGERGGIRITPEQEHAWITRCTPQDTHTPA